MKPNSARAKGSRLEREAAAVMGMKRAPLSGAVGGGDAWRDPSKDSLFADSWVFEMKARKRIALLYDALEQAEKALGIGSLRKPAAVVRADRRPALFVARLDDVDQWVRALAETGRAHQIKSLARKISRLADDIRGLAS